MTEFEACGNRHGREPRPWRSHRPRARGRRLRPGARRPRIRGRCRTWPNPFVKKGRDVTPVAGDVTDALRASPARRAAGELGGLDVLVNNASDLGGIGPLMEFDVQRFGRVFPVNAGAPIALIQLAVPLLAERRGLIVNITSDAAHGRVSRLGTIRREQGGARTADPHAGNGTPRPRRVRRDRRSGRHAHAHAPGGVPARRHLRPPAAGR